MGWKSLLFFNLFLLVGCITPVSESNIEPESIAPLPLIEGKSWIYQISAGNIKYDDSLVIEGARLIKYKGRDITVSLVKQPCLTTLDRDTIIKKYWRLDQGKLLEYGLEKYRYSPDFPVYQRVYSDSIVLVDYDQNSPILLFTNDTLYTEQSSRRYLTINGHSHFVIPVRTVSDYATSGWAECDYQTNWGNYSLLQINGSIKQANFKCVLK